MASSSNSSNKAIVLLFDIGGVCVVSPMQAILDFEKRTNLPLGWINFSISASGPQGAWSLIERGEVPLDAAWFTHFKSDLTNEARWREYYARHLARTKKQGKAQAAEEAAYQVPAVPDIDAEFLFWEMMRISRAHDPYMFPALKELRAAADKSNGGIILGALSNTLIFPPEHAYNDPTTAEGKKNTELKGIFDIFVSSAHVGIRKPEEEIYRYAFRRLREFAKFKGRDIDWRDVTFLDDIGANLRPAKNLGFNTIKVNLGRTRDAVEELEKITGLKLKEERARI